MRNASPVLLATVLLGCGPGGGSEPLLPITSGSEGMSSSGTSLAPGDSSSIGPPETSSSTTTTDSTRGDTSSSDTSSSSSAGGGLATIPEDLWTEGPAPARIGGPALLDLPGGLAGPPLWVSNNPERVFGPGWLFQHARTDPTRGGDALPLESFVAYVFHLNASGQPLTFHWIATNPGATTATVTARGSLYGNAEHPIGVGSGPSVAVADDLLTEAAPIDLESEIEPGEGVELGRIEMSQATVLDGRIEVEATRGIYLYMVASSDGSTQTALNLSQGSPAPGEILERGPNAFGRMAGVFERSRWEAEFTAEVPAAPAHVGLALNTNDKFTLDGATLQDQTATALMHLADASTQSYGNYGMLYALQISLCAASETRTVALRLGSNFTAPTNTPSFTWNGPVRIDDAVVDVYTTPTAPSVEIAQRVIAAGDCEDVTIELPVPGLITAGQQLVLESL